MALGNTSGGGLAVPQPRPRTPDLELRRRQRASPAITAWSLRKCLKLAWTDPFSHQGHGMILKH